MFSSASHGATRRRRDLLAAAGFLAPALIALGVMRIYPMIRAVIDALTQQLPGSLTPAHWVGFSNFSALFHSSFFWQSVKQTLVFNAIINPAQVILALA